MVLASIDAHSLAQSGADALRQGDARTARASFERIIDAGAGGCRELSRARPCLPAISRDAPVALAALDKALELEPQISVR